MQAPQVRTLDAGRRVQVFLDNEAAVLGATVAPSLRGMLDRSVTQLAAFQHQQGTATGTAQGETANQAALRADLYTRFMVPVGKTAKIELKTTPEFPNLVVPASALRRIDFTATANTFAEAAAKHEQLLVQHGMPADFLAQLTAAITLVAASADAKHSNLALKKAATEGCRTASKAVRDKIGQIDSVIRAAFKANAPLMAQWQASKRIKQLPVTPLPTGSPATTTSTPEVTTNPTA